MYKRSHLWIYQCVHALRVYLSPDVHIIWDREACWGKLQHGLRSVGWLSLEVFMGKSSEESSKSWENRDNRALMFVISCEKLKKMKVQKVDHSESFNFLQPHKKNTSSHMACLSPTVLHY